MSILGVLSVPYDALDTVPRSSNEAGHQPAAHGTSNNDLITLANDSFENPMNAHFDIQNQFVTDASPGTAGAVQRDSADCLLHANDRPLHGGQSPDTGPQILDMNLRP